MDTQEWYPHGFAEQLRRALGNTISGPVVLDRLTAKSLAEWLETLPRALSITPSPPPATAQGRETRDWPSVLCLAAGELCYIGTKTDYGTPEVRALLRRSAMDLEECAKLLRSRRVEAEPAPVASRWRGDAVANQRQTQTFSAPPAAAVSETPDEEGDELEAILGSRPTHQCAGWDCANCHERDNALRELLAARRSEAGDADTQRLCRCGHHREDHSMYGCIQKDATGFNCDCDKFALPCRVCNGTGVMQSPAATQEGRDA